MIEIGPATEPEMILAFLKAEVNASRYSVVIQQCLGYLATQGFSRGELIERPDLSDQRCNEARLWILKVFRGYRQNQYLFRGFPSDVIWRRIELEPHELHLLRYANEPNWVRFSDNTRKPAQMALNLSSGKVPRKDADRICATQDALSEGKRFPELIAVEGPNGELILLEGHSRATAYVASGF